MVRNFFVAMVALALVVAASSSASAGLFRRGGGNMDGGKNGAACSNAPLKAATAANAAQAPAVVPFKKTAPAKEETGIRPGSFNRPLDSRAAIAWTSTPGSHVLEHIAVTTRHAASPTSLAAR